MANLRIGSSIFRHVGLATVMGVVVYGGSMLRGQSLPRSPASERVVEVRIVGNETIPKAKILRHIRTRVGRAFDQEMIEEDVRRLDSTRMFVNVEPFRQRVPRGVVVVFKVYERPTLQNVQFVGNKKIKTKVLEKEVDLSVGDALDPFAVEQGRTKLDEFYHSRGFTRARVSIREGNKTGDRQAIYVINEGQKQKIFRTRFIGNTIAGDARLKTQIQSKPPILYLFKGEVDKAQIDEDVNRLTAYYRSLGFFQARIGRTLDFNASQSWATLTFVIDEGPRYKVRNVSFFGNSKFATEELASGLSLKDGQHFNQSQMTKDVAAIQNKYGEVGYIFADVEADPRFLEEPGILDLVYNISEGDRYRVGRIDVEIKGDYPHTRITTVLNRLSLSPGDIMDIRKLRASERRLRASGLFLIDPVTRTEPKIVFSPPTFDEEEENVAGRSRSPSKVRGQSPDLVPRDGWKWSPSADSRPGDRRLDLTLPCRWTSPDAERRAGAIPQFHVEPPPPPPEERPPETVIRGQGGYSSEGGWAMPGLRPRSQTFGARTPVGRYVPQGTPSPVYQAPATSPAPPPLQPGPSLGTATTPSAPIYGSQPPSAGQPYAGGSVMQPPRPADAGLFGPDSPYLTAPGDEELTRPLPLRVVAEETQTGRLMFGVGVNSDAGLVGSVVIDEQNFDWTRFPRSWEDIRNATAWRGAGQRFRVEAIPGTLVQRYMFNFQEPYFLDTAVGLGLSAYYYDRRYREWDEERLGGRVSVGYQFTHDLSGNLAFRSAKINIRNPIAPTLPELAEVAGDNALYGLRVQLAHDTRD